MNTLGFYRCLIMMVLLFLLINQVGQGATSRKLVVQGYKEYKIGAPVSKLNLKGFWASVSTGDEKKYGVCHYEKQIEYQVDGVAYKANLALTESDWRLEVVELIFDDVLLAIGDKKSVEEFVMKLRKRQIAEFDMKIMELDYFPSKGIGVSSPMPVMGGALLIQGEDDVKMKLAWDGYKLSIAYFPYLSFKHQKEASEEAQARADAEEKARAEAKIRERAAKEQEDREFAQREAAAKARSTTEWQDILKAARDKHEYWHKRALEMCNVTIDMKSRISNYSAWRKFLDDDEKNQECLYLGLIQELILKKLARQEIAPDREDLLRKWDGGSLPYNGLEILEALNTATGQQDELSALLPYTYIWITEWPDYYFIPKSIEDMRWLLRNMDYGRVYLYENGERESDWPARSIEL